MKIKTALFLIVLLAGFTAASAQNGTHAPMVQDRSSQPYHVIRINGEMDIVLVQAETPGLSVEGTAKQLDNTVTMLQNDTLVVFQNNVLRGDSKTRVTINVNELTLLEVSGKSKVDCSRLVNGNFFTVRAKDGARIRIDVRS